MMATGPEHYEIAEKLLKDWESESVGELSTELVLAAQAHATLALAAATALRNHERDVDYADLDDKAWIKVASEYAKETS